MPTTTRTIRVFISSTFSDLKAERNALQERVFPRLKRYCQRRGWSFQAIDLRFRLRQGYDGQGGMPAKDANGETANSWEYCRQWIDRVEPVFVCILGQHYPFHCGIRKWG